MATVKGLTAERTLEIEKNAITNARIESVGAARNLILVKHDGTDVPLGDIRGPQGGGSPFVVLTQAAYTALATKDPATLYVIKG